MKNKLKDGLYENLASADYHSDSALGSSSLKTLATKTPAHLKGMERKESASFDIGTAFHTLILEPAKEDTIICGGDDRRGNRWKELKAEADFNGNVILTTDDYNKVFTMRDAFMKNAEAMELIGTVGRSELSLFHTDKQTGVRCKIRPDRINDKLNCMVDLKTALTASPEGFARAVADYGYHIQQAFYLRTWNSHFASKQIENFYFLVIEKEPPFASAIYQLDAFSVMEGHNMVNHGLTLYRQCMTSNVWNGYPAGIQQISIPRYAFKTIDFSEQPVIGVA